MADELEIQLANTKRLLEMSDARVNRLREQIDSMLLTFEEQAEAFTASTDQIMKAFWDNDRHRQAETIHSALSRLYQLICIVRNEQTQDAPGLVWPEDKKRVLGAVKPPSCICTCGHPRDIHMGNLGCCAYIKERNEDCECSEFKDAKLVDTTNPPALNVTMQRGEALPQNQIRAMPFIEYENSKPAIRKVADSQYELIWNVKDGVLCVSALDENEIAELVLSLKDMMAARMPSREPVVYHFPPMSVRVTG